MCKRHQSGFTLVEVLVALLIVSIGLLGIAAMQSLALRNTGSSMERSQAVIQTYSYLDVLRANRDRAVLSQLDMSMVCDAENLPSSQVEQRSWITQLQQTMGPDSCGKVECLGGGKCTITVQWNDTRAEGGSAVQELVTETVL
ncbi:MAG TPA: type IV pilus modification protein PilV [Steroidobacteraceae bacterium]|nr:type IV pilus modification protein PilV [Steroidobacteraceae bacterium]